MPGNKGGLCYVLAALITPLSMAQPLAVRASHGLAIARPAEMVAVPWTRVLAALPCALPQKLVIKDGAGRSLPYQVTNLDYDARGIRAGFADLLFQYDFGAGEQAVDFTVDSSATIVPPLPSRTFARIVPERLDDFSWENDRIGHRAYGPALGALGAPDNGGVGKEVLVASGIDVWSKRVRYPVIDRATFVPGPVGVDVFSSRGNKDNSTTGKLSLQKQFNRDWMAYIMTATGHKGKAYDVTSGLRAAAAFPVAPEKSSTVEICAKANLFNNRMSLAATVYNTEFRGYQQNVSFVLPNDPTIYTQLNSIPRIRTHGFELDTNILVAQGLSVNAALAYTLPTIEEWKNGPCYADSTNLAVGTTRLADNGSLAGQNRACFPITTGSTVGIQNLSGGVFPGTPKIKANIGTHYDFKIGTVGVVTNFNIRYQGDYSTNINNDPRSVNRGYSIADLGFGIRGAGGRYKLSFRINNLCDRFYIPNANASGHSYRAGPTSTSPSITVNSWVPPRDVFHFFSVKLDVKY